ncbi:MAG: hypothetical protein M0008_14685 [Actinomycetota bacterium]|jgi:hypothetical protein|nr:hypothetical protein [Actinomycetota bacterium]
MGLNPSLSKESFLANRYTAAIGRQTADLGDDLLFVHGVEHSASHEDLYQRIEVPGDWAEGLREAIAAEVATHHEDTTAEREALTLQQERLEAERYKLMDAYYANAIDVTMLRREQERIGAELRTITSRQGVLDGSLDD